MDFFGDLMPNASGVEGIPDNGADKNGLEVPINAEGNIEVKIKPTPVECPEWIAPVQAKIAEWFKAGFKKHINNGVDPSNAQVIEHINNLLKTNEAIISGGFILEAIQNSNYKSFDIDIYVPSKNLYDFNRPMSKLFSATSFFQYNASSYCLSFLRKNGIRCVQTYRRIERGQDGINFYKGMDIMGVRLRNNPLNVVQNFDLTFCQVWYDGEMVYATHPQHIKDRKGLLQNDYVTSLMNGNKFIQNRIRKYKSRGFQISVEPTSKVILENQSCKRLEKNDEYYKKWVSRALFYIMLYHSYKATTSDIRYNYASSFNSVNLQTTTHVGPSARYQKNLLDNIEDIDEMPSIEPSDGYDSDEFDITKPYTYNPVINDWFVPADKIVEWDALDMENKFRKNIHAFLQRWYSVSANMSPLGAFDIENLYFLFEETSFAPYYDALKQYTKREAMDAISLDDTEVFDLHTHTLDQAIGRESMEAHLRTVINVRDRYRLPCYIAECTWHLNLEEIRPIVSMEFYQEFIRPIPQPPTPLLGEQVVAENPDPDLVRKVDVKDILQNAPSDAGAWRNIYHHIMCPFCLCYITRDAGCTYVYHDNPDALPYDLMPFCKAQNLISEVIDKYKLVAGHNGVETCAECGRPCSNHRHFDFNDPPGFVVQGANPDYSRCPGGGRREGIARILAVKQTMIDNPELEIKELRRRAALAAEAAAQDGVMLAKADVILAKERFERTDANLDAALVAAVLAAGPVAAPALIDPANAQEAADLQAALNAIDALEAQQAQAPVVAPAPPPPLNIPIFDPNAVNMNVNEPPEGGKRVGKMTCPHGYGSYKSVIKSTRKHKKQSKQSKRKTMRQ